MSRFLRLPGWMLLAVIGSTLLASCASTSLVSSDRNPDYSGPALKRVMVVGTTADPRARKAFEDEFVAKLTAAGVSAVPSYPLLPESGTTDAEELRKAAERAGVDGVLAARLVRVEESEAAQQAQAFNFVDRSAGFYGYYSAATGPFDPTGVGQSDTLTIHFDLYSVAAARLAWSGKAATFPSTDVRQVAAGLAYTLIPALKNERLIG